ncbi:MAG: M24 family metallopeptidase, partial [Lachnospiraceae bacterium]
NTLSPNEMYGNVSSDCLFLFDFGIKYRGLFSDCTITLKFSKYTKEEIYRIKKLEALQCKIAQNISAGKTVHNILKEVVSDLCLSDGEQISRGFGHSVGAEIHENFSFVKGYKGQFKDKMIFTIEPEIIIKQNGNENNPRIQNRYIKKIYRIEYTYALLDGNVINFFSNIPIINEISV